MSVDWSRIASIGAGITVGAKCVPYTSLGSEFERRELEKMRERVKALAKEIGMEIASDG